MTSSKDKFKRVAETGWGDFDEKNDGRGWGDFRLMKRGGVILD